MSTGYYTSPHWMRESLAQIGISRIVVADDDERHLRAAKELESVLPSVEVLDFATPSSAVGAIRASSRDQMLSTLVLTDSTMERRGDGIDVFCVALDSVSPCIVVADEPFRVGRAGVRLVPSLWLPKQSLGGTRANPQVWEYIVSCFIGVAHVEREGLWPAFMEHRRNGGLACGFIAQQLKRSACRELGMDRVVARV